MNYWFDWLLSIEFSILAFQARRVLLKITSLCTLGAFRLAWLLCSSAQYLPYVQNHYLKSVSTCLAKTAARKMQAARPISASIVFMHENFTPKNRHHLIELTGYEVALFGRHPAQLFLQVQAPSR